MAMGKGEDAFAWGVTGLARCQVRVLASEKTPYSRLVVPGNRPPSTAIIFSGVRAEK